MKDNKLIEVLSSIKQDAIKDVEDFIYYAAKQETGTVAWKDVVSLYKILMALINSNHLHTTSEEVLFEKIYPNNIFSKNKLNKLFSNLLKCIEKYIVFKYFSANSFETVYALTDYYFLNKMPHRYELSLEKLKGQLAYPVEWSMAFFYQKYQISLLEYHVQTHYNTKKDSCSSNKAIMDLDIFYVVSRLELTIIHLTLKSNTNFNLKKEITNIQPLLSIIEANKLSDNPIIKTYLLTLDIVQKQGDILLYRQLLNQYESYLSFEQRKMLRAIARNYYTFYYNKGKNEYLIEIFEMLNSDLEKGYLFYENQIFSSTYQNIIAIGLKLKKFETVKFILDNYHSKILSVDTIAEVNAFNLSHYYFHIKDYNAARLLLPIHYKFKDSHYDIAQRLLEIKIYYELNDIDILEAKLNAFKNYIFEWTHLKKEHTLPSHIFELNNNFINLLKRLMDTPVKQIDRLLKLKQQMIEKKTYAEREWLMEKINAKM